MPSMQEAQLEAGGLSSISVAEVAAVVGKLCMDEMCPEMLSVRWSSYSYS